MYKREYIFHNILINIEYTQFVVCVVEDNTIMLPSFISFYFVKHHSSF